MEFGPSYPTAITTLGISDARHTASWLPWPTDCPVDLHVAQALSHMPKLVALFGHGAAGPRGQRGLVGIPANIQPVAGRIAESVDSRRQHALRVLLLGYELGVAQLGIQPLAVPPGQPIGLAIDLDAWLWCDHYSRTYAIDGPNPVARAQLADALQVRPAAQKPGLARFVPAVSDAQHADRLERLLHHIAAGDIYQANLTRRLRLHGHVNALGVLAALRCTNPVPHAAYLRVHDFMLASASMETLVTYDPAHRAAASFPIKGTCRHDPQDPQAPTRLLADPKERAEHVMIVDLVRNDLSRVAAPGTVKVPELMQAEAFRSVWHGVSKVTAALPPEQTPGALAAALFPGGSITGAPKHRAVSLLQTIEAEGRGVYTGSLGYITPTGDMSFSILIRTLVHDARGWSLNVGGGIVADSTAAREIAETWEKAEAFMEVLRG